MPKHKKRKKVMSDDSRNKLKTFMKGSWYNQDHRKDDQCISVSSRKNQTETKHLEEENRGNIIVDLDILNSQISENTCC